MNFNLTEDQIIIRDTAKTIAENLIKPTAASRDRNEQFPKEILKELAELGYLGMLVEDKYDGVNFDSISYSLVLQEFAKADASVAVIISVSNSLTATSIQLYGSEDQKENYLRRLAQGKALGAFALSEAVSGSDAASLRSTAIRDGDYYIVNGEKLWITSAENADIFVVFLRTNLNVKGAKGISAFIIEKGTVGFEILPKEQKMGLRSSDTCAIRFNDCKIHKDQLLGEEGKGFNIAMSLLDGGRIGIASQAIGIAQACLDESIKYSKQREQFGQSISQFQAIQFKIARMAMRIESARLLTYKAANLRDQKNDMGAIASMAKLSASETAVWCSEQAIQIHGGNGYIKDFPVEKYFRDAKVTEIYEGTSEIQQIVIARQFLT